MKLIFSCIVKKTLLLKYQPQNKTPGGKRTNKIYFKGIAIQIYKVLYTGRNNMLHVIYIPLKVNFLSISVNINLPSMMAKWRGVASSHCGFLLLMSIRGFCRRRVTRLTLPLLAAAWSGVFPVSAGQFTSTGGFT